MGSSEVLMLQAIVNLSNVLMILVWQAIVDLLNIGVTAAGHTCQPTSDSPEL